MSDRLLVRDRKFCRGRRIRVLSLSLALLFAPMALQQCGGPIVQGNTYINAWCSGGSTGEMSFTAVTTGFYVPEGQINQKIHYEFTIWFNGLHYWSDRSGDYYVDRYGNHNGMSRRTFSCDQHGVWRIYVVTVSDGGNYNSYGQTTEVAC